jgi:hypothetical protein
MQNIKAFIVPASDGNCHCKSLSMNWSFFRMSRGESMTGWKRHDLLNSIFVYFAFDRESMNEWCNSERDFIGVRALFAFLF